jgi:hypothetical protein
VVEAMLRDGKAESVGFIRGRMAVGLQIKYWRKMQGGKKRESYRTVMDLEA